MSFRAITGSACAGCAARTFFRSIITLTSSPVSVSVAVPGVIAGRELPVGDDSVHQHPRHDVEDRGEDDAVERPQQRIGQERVIEQVREAAAADLKVDWKPDLPSSLCVTWTLLMASAMSGGAGTAIVGPIINARWRPSTCNHRLRQRHAQAPALARRVSSSGFMSVVGVAEPPVVQRIAKRALRRVGLGARPARRRPPAAAASLRLPAETGGAYTKPSVRPAA